MKNNVGKIVLFTFGLSCLVLFFQNFTKISNDFGSDKDWADYLGGPDRNHFSKLEQINLLNVKNLKVAWEYSLPDSGQMQMNPIVVDGVLYGVSATVQAFAINAATGKEIWRFGEPLINASVTSRGVSFWTDGKEKRILYTLGSKLWALDALTGIPIKNFGDNGNIDLHLGLPKSAKNKSVISNTPGTIYNDLIIMPVRLAEDENAAPGDIRAFNVKTGKLVWTFHTIPYPGEYGYETFPKDAYKNNGVGAVNNWSGMSLDKNRGILYVPLGSAAYDFYGGNRKGKNLYSNCLLALDVKTGKRIWHYQTIHHDIWDRDLPAPPNLITLNNNGKTIDAIAQITKQGYVFVFDRLTGRSLFKINETKVPASSLKGEVAWATQPIPSLPKPFARQSYELTSDQISPFAENKQELIKRLKTYKTTLFAPPSEEGTLIYPGFDGGGEWGGAAVDKEGILYVNSNEMAWIQTMKETPTNKALSSLTLGEKTYVTNCQACHGKNLKGNALSGYPSLENISKKYDTKTLNSIINEGKGRMSGFGHISAIEKSALVAFLNKTEKKELMNTSTASNTYNPLYKMQGYNKFLDNRGLPAVAPPWGTLNAIDLNTGAYIWKIVLGDEPLLKKEGILGTGSENYGGPVVTATNLLFIAATKDAMIRAFNSKTGELVWQYQLPAAAFATPSTYMVNNKQYIAIACGGTKLGTPKGNKIIAFALDL